MDWIDLAQNRDGWRVLVNALMKLPGSIKCGEYGRRKARFQTLLPLTRSTDRRSAWHILYLACSQVLVQCAVCKTTKLRPVTPQMVGG